MVTASKVQRTEGPGSNIERVVDQDSWGPRAVDT
jgi:hypothetical protein